MGLMQQAVETYDCHAAYVGKYVAGHTVLAPVSHVVTRADLEITLNAAGQFCAARAVDKKEPKIVIPVTENSAGRTSGVCAHPLCDQLGYLAAYDGEKHEDYCRQLQRWAEDTPAHPKLRPILTYVQGGTILADLAQCGLIRLDAQGRPDDGKADKLLVRWRVIGLGDGAPEACWEDPTLFAAFIRFYERERSDAPRTLCLVEGRVQRRAQQHPKGIVPAFGNAKLISANDKDGFTYLGRFSNEEQATGVGYEASQKAHNALRWLAAEQGAQGVFGGRTFLCWNPQGREVCHAAGAFARFAEPVREPTDYQKKLQQTLEGYRSQLPETAGVVVAAFDAATSGRLALTYYNELRGSELLQRLYDWDARCCWPNGAFGIQSPPLWQIVHCAFGVQQQGMLKADGPVLRQQIQRLLSCRLDRAAMPVDIVRALAQRASRPLAYDKELRPRILTTACAVIRKYRHDRYKEEWSMSLEENRADRSYQFGRLLAVLEKVELTAQQRAGEERETNAMRLQATFCQRPLYTANVIERQLEQAYFPRLQPATRAFYKKLLGQIMEQISAAPQQAWNRPLEETYLMGYYLQRNALYAPKNTENTKEDPQDESAK